MNGTQAIRIFEPCASPTGEGCTVFEDPQNLHLQERRWYPSTARIFDGSLLIVGGMHEDTPFFNTDPALSFEFFPPKESTPRPSEFLKRSLPANLFPRCVYVYLGALRLLIRSYYVGLSRCLMAQSSW